MNHTILDSVEFKKPNLDKAFFSVISWWEKKRIEYNLLLFGSEVAIILFCFQKTIEFGIVNSILETLLVNFFANLFYSLGETSEILLIYYLNLKGKSYRNFIYYTGTLFSLILTCFMYFTSLSL